MHENKTMQRARNAELHTGGFKTLVM